MAKQLQDPQRIFTVEGETNESTVILAALNDAFDGKWTYDDGAGWFNAKLPDAIWTTRQSVYVWTNSETRPSKTFLYNLMLHYQHTDPQYKLAQTLMNLRESGNG